MKFGTLCNYYKHFGTCGYNIAMQSKKTAVR